MSNAPLSIPGWMFDVPPPTPAVMRASNPVFCSMTIFSISPMMSCSVMGFVAM